MKNRFLLVVVLSAILFVPLTAINSNAGIEPSPFRLTGVMDNAIFWVLFNPQPEPPGLELRLDTTNLQAPIFTLNNPANNNFGLSMGFYDSSKRFAFDNRATNQLIYSIFEGSSNVPTLTATFSFSSLGSDVMFNPQPEPPGIDPFTYSCTLTPDPTFVSSLQPGQDIDMTLNVTDASGNLVSLTPTASVPEPSTMLLLGGGLAGLALWRKSKQQK